MQLRDLFLYLIGNRGAILRIAQSRSALWIALLFVLSAGLARNYDTESLLHEPWHVLLPLVASTLSATVLYGIVFGMAAVRREKGASFTGGFRAFLTLFWMTAPMAWLYGIPHEQWMEAPDAVALNLWTLALVSIWRVLLMARVVAVLFDLRVTQTLWIIALYGNGVIFALLAFTPVPVFNIMGGVRQSDEDAIVAAAVFNVTMLSFITVPVLFLAALAVWPTWKPRWQLAPLPGASPRPVSRPLFATVAVSIFLWIPLLPIMQPAQQHRHVAESMLRGGDVEGGLAYMSQFDRRDFPAIWDPPPRLSYRERTPELFDVLGVAIEENAAPWVQRAYGEKLALRLQTYIWREDDELDRCVELLKRLPNGRELAESVVPLVESRLRYTEATDPHHGALTGLLALAGVPYEPPDPPQSDAP